MSRPMMMLTNTIGGGSTPVLFAPGYNYEVPDAIIEKVVRTISGKEYRYTWGSYKRWEIPIERITKANAALINSWRSNNTTVYFYPFYSTVPGTYHTVKIKTNTSPLNKMKEPLWDTYYSGNLILEVV